MIGVNGMKIYLKLLAYVLNIKKEIGIKVLIGLGHTFTYLFQALLMARVVNTVWQSGSVAKILLDIVAVVFLLLVRGLISKELEGFNKTLAARIKSKIRVSMIDKIFTLGPGYMNAKRSGDTISLLMDGIENLEAFFVNYIPQIFVVLVTGVFAFAYLVRLDRISSFILIGSMIISVVIPMLSMPIIDKHVTDYWREYSLVTSEYIDTIQGMTTLKTMDCETERGIKLQKRAESFCRRSVKNTGISLFNSGIMLVLSGITSSVAVVTDGILVSRGLAPEAALTAFLFLAVECARPMAALNQYWHSSFLGMSVARDLFVLLEKEPDIQNGKRAISQGLEETPPKISLENVSFEYQKDTPVLNHVSLEIEEGMTAAFVGHSGSGKSTLLNLLMRFYDVKDGAIYINGHDLRSYDIDYLRKNIAVVFQDSFLFYDTIRENIRIAKPYASDEEIVRAAKSANIHNFIMSLPEGYDTWVGERGLTLSGGQRQRISIARAILKDSAILLLDEATSSVDAVSEAKIQEALKTVMNNRTTIVVAHRLSTIQNADRIFVFTKGELVEEGNHETLLHKNGTYASFIRAQEVDSYEHKG